MPRTRSIKPKTLASFFPDPIGKIAPYVLLVLAVLITYADVYNNAFLYDDITLVLNNTFLTDGRSLPAIFTTAIDAGANVSSSYYRPLQILSYFIVYQLAGYSLVAFHLLNIGLHAINACLIYALGRRLNFSPWAVFLGTLIWAVHPVHVETITYISGTADPLYVLFCLLGLLTVLPDVAPKKIFYAIPFFVLALLSKEEALTFPLLVMVCIFFVSKQRFEIKTYLRSWPLCAIAAIYGIAHASIFPMQSIKTAMETTTNQPFITHTPYTFFATLPVYLKMLIMPSGLHFERSFPVFPDFWNTQVLAGLLIFLLAAWHIFWYQDRRRLPLSWGLLWFGAAYFLHTGFLFTSDKSIYEHWMYLPSAGLFLSIAQTLAMQTEKNAVMVKYARGWCVMAVLIATAFAWHTWNQNKIWHDAESLYGNVFANGETSPHAHNNLGMIYAQKGDYQRAQEQFDLALRYSNDTLPEAEYNMAEIILRQYTEATNTKRAISHLQRALELDPDNYIATSKLADCYERLGDKTQADLYRTKADSIHKKFTPSMP